MRPPKFAEFSYLHDDAVWPAWLKVLLVTGLLAALAAVYVWSVSAIPFVIPGLIFWIILISMLAPRRKIILSPRYIVCGNTVMHFRNIRIMDIQAAQGRLKLVTASGQMLTLEREKFPTKARKAHKIEANQQAKFCKVADKLIACVRISTPEATIRGEDSLKRPACE